MYTDRLKILLVEDDEDDHFLIREMLSGALLINPELLWVSDGEAALGVMEEQRFDACLLDYRLGSESGLDLLTRLAAVGSGTPIILLTGYGDRLVLKNTRTIQLAIQDNGIGFDVGSVSGLRESERGMGLSSMKERAELSGGTFSI